MSKKKEDIEDPKRNPLKYWGCGVDHMIKDSPHH